MAVEHFAWLLQLPRRARQHRRDGVFSSQGDTCLASCSATSDALATLREHCQPLDYPTPNSASLSQRTLLRQTPEAGAVCGSSARADLRGCRPKGRSLPRPERRSLRSRASFLRPVLPFDQEHLWDILSGVTEHRSQSGWCVDEAGWRSLSASGLLADLRLGAPR
jgi:hypothetical protein